MGYRGVGIGGGVRKDVTGDRESVSGSRQRERKQFVAVQQPSPSPDTVRS
jgi:hypothetical protein